MSTESLWNKNLLARYAHLPMAEERQQFLQHKLDKGSSWSSLRQLGIYIAAAVSRIRLTSESRLTPKAIDIAAKAWANREPHASRLTDPQQVIEANTRIDGAFPTPISLDLPVSGRVTTASKAKPYLGMSLDLDVKQIPSLRTLRQDPTSDEA
jgi:hypothetical protein